MEERFSSFQHANARDNWLYRPSRRDFTPVAVLSRCPSKRLTLLYLSPVLLCAAARRSA